MTTMIGYILALHDGMEAGHDGEETDVVRLTLGQRHGCKA